MFRRHNRQILSKFFLHELIKVVCQAGVNFHEPDNVITLGSRPACMEMTEHDNVDRR